MTLYEPTMIRDNFENNKCYNIPRAQLIIADIPYNIGNFAYGSNPSWYVGGDNSNGESDKAGKSFFDRDGDFKLANLLHFCSRLLVPEPKNAAKAKESKREPGCMFVFCNWKQVHEIIEIAKRPEYGWNHAELFVFRKRHSAQALKANMRCCGNYEVAVQLYKDKLPKFRNGRRPDGSGIMEFTCREWMGDASDTPKVHPTQKPVPLIRDIIRLFTDPGDVVIDPCAGSGSTLAAAYLSGRRSWGFDIKKEFVQGFEEQMMPWARKQAEREEMEGRQLSFEWEGR